MSEQLVRADIREKKVQALSGQTALQQVANKRRFKQQTKRLEAMVVNARRGKAKVKCKATAKSKAISLASGQFAEIVESERGQDVGLDMQMAEGAGIGSSVKVEKVSGNAGRVVVKKDPDVVFESSGMDLSIGLHCGQLVQVVSEFCAATRAGQIGQITKLDVENGRCELFLPGVGGCGVTMRASIAEIQLSFIQLSCFNCCV